MSELETATEESIRTAEPPPEPPVDNRYGPEPLLRRMLATADMLAVVLAAIAAGLWQGRTGPAVVYVLSAPIWIVVAKLARLYDRDQQTMRHLTVDEVPWLLMWTLISVSS